MTEEIQAFDVATVGNYTKDTIITASGTLHADGGGVTYSAHAAHTLGRRWRPSRGCRKMIFTLSGRSNWPASPSLPRRPRARR